MGVFIKGMEMPERCGQCFLRVGNCEQRMYMEHRPKGCPLVEVKEPHGRLGDLDALQKQIKLNVQDAHMGALWKQGMTYAHGLVETSKTVIEAEGSEE